jgi:nucleoid-associated protein YgaU
MKYKQIFDANRDQLDDPDKIEVGQVLVVPNP